MRGVPTRCDTIQDYLSNGIDRGTPAASFDHQTRRDGRRPKRFEDVGHLLFAVEVLSPSTSDARTIERSMPDDRRVEVLADRIQWQPAGARQLLDIDLEDYFRRVLDE